MGFIMNSERLMFWHDNVYYDAGWIFHYLSYQKAIAVTDETGDYFTYEDINSHYPQGYPIYETITAYIKSITKPFRFSLKGAALKAPIRISQAAALDLEKNWFFTEHQITIDSYKPRKRKL